MNVSGVDAISRSSRSPVGVSLLAIALLHSTFSLTDIPLSRAGSLLQGIWGVSWSSDKAHWPGRCLPGPDQLNGKIRDGCNRGAALSR
ncbi:hypothetical protein DBR24_05770 [Pseudomonas sp. HMWF006]|nr:hypothetical protein DBR24_05770 [Pseudomonas sp. HMWF006]PTT69293.1 hypothetical protein DBR26_11855 [Pseudomonas sp. HMWF007]